MECLQAAGLSQCSSNVLIKNVLEVLLQESGMYVVYTHIFVVMFTVSSVSQQCKYHLNCFFLFKRKSAAKVIELQLSLRGQQGALPAAN